MKFFWAACAAESLRAVYLSNEDVEGAFSNVSEALENLKPEAFNAMIDADIALFNGVVVKNRFNSIVRVAWAV